MFFSKKKISNGEEPDCEPTILTEREIEISTLLAEGFKRENRCRQTVY